MAKYSMNPWLEIQGMKEKMDSLMEEALERFEGSDRISERPATWCPAADAYETENSYVIQLELAGLKKEDVSLEVANQELWVSGEREMIKEVSGSRYQFLERAYGPFARKFELEENADLKHIQAFFRNGLLTIMIPKGGDFEYSKKIEVSEE